MRRLEKLQLDALREVGNIGAGHAATALSELTGERTMINVPQVIFIPVEEVSQSLMGSSSDSFAVSVMLSVFGDITGRILMLFPRDCAINLVNMLLGGEDERAILAEMEQSSLKEVVNILSGSYLSALSSFLEMSLLPSIPNLIVDAPGAILNLSFSDLKEDRVFCIETHFIFPGKRNKDIRGYFLLMPNLNSLNNILKSMQLE